MDTEVLHIEGSNSLPLDSYESYGCRVNAIAIPQLFQRYEQVGFLYAAKRQRLDPYWDEIASNWRKGCRGGELIHYVVSYDDPATQTWASISAWRSTHTGWNTQHLVSMGSPAGSRAVMLASQAVRIRDGYDRAHGNWFTPTNRFAGKVFGSIVRTLGATVASVAEYDYLAVPLAVCQRAGVGVTVESFSARHAISLVELAVLARGQVYVDGEELGHDDVLLEAVDDLYRKIGLRRYRRIWLAFHSLSDQPIGAAIAYRGPLGFNFSFLENRCDLLMDPTLIDVHRVEVCRSLLYAAATAYDDFPPKAVLITADDRTGVVLQSLGGKLLRRYAQSIWLQAGFESWYRHVDQFYSRVLRAGHTRGFASRSMDSAPTGKELHL